VCYGKEGLYLQTSLPLPVFCEEQYDCVNCAYETGIKETNSVRTATRPKSEELYLDSMTANV
jgi:hypothetical protein